ncbi:hypothetical protein FACS1894184_04930 [Clostridia bacterium]|nr:hypothetical protein FACS1894184_04930 [Clostridia bacterium]
MSRKNPPKMMKDDNKRESKTRRGLTILKSIGSFFMGEGKLIKIVTTAGVVIALIVGCFQLWIWGRSQTEEATTTNSIELGEYASLNNNTIIQGNNNTITIMPELPKPPDPERQTQDFKTGLIYMEQSDYEYAKHYFINSLEAVEEIAGIGSYDAATLRAYIGYCCLELSQYDEALRYYNEALAAINDTEFERDELGGIINNAICALLSEKGENLKALNMYEEWLKIYQPVFGEESKDTAGVYNNIGIIYIKNGDYSKAIEYCEKAVSITDSSPIFDNEEVDTFKYYSNYALAYALTENYEDALTWYKEALQNCQLVRESDSIDIGSLYAGLGSVYYFQSNYDYAIDCLLKAIPIYEQTFGFGIEKTTLLYSLIAENYFNIFEHRASIEWSIKRISSLELSHDANDPIFIKPYSNLALTYYYIGEYEDAQIWYSKSLSIRETLNDFKDRFASVDCINLANIYYYCSDYDNAMTWYAKADELQKSLKLSDDLNYAISYLNRAYIYTYNGDTERVTDMVVKAEDYAGEVTGIDKISLDLVYYYISGMCYEEGNFAGTIEYGLNAIYYFAEYYGMLPNSAVEMIDNMRISYEYVESIESFESWMEDNNISFYLVYPNDEA